MYHTSTKQILCHTVYFGAYGIFRIFFSFCLKNASLHNNCLNFPFFMVLFQNCCHNLGIALFFKYFFTTYQKGTGDPPKNVLCYGTIIAVNSHSLQIVPAQRGVSNSWFWNGLAGAIITPLPPVIAINTLLWHFALSSPQRDAGIEHACCVIN